MTIDSFLSRLPSVIALEQRLALEAIGYALDLICLAYRRMLAQLRAVSPISDESISRSLLVLIFADAWLIVDQAHMLRSLLRSIEPKISTPTIREFISTFENATFLRNEMDHLHQNINNISKSKKVLPPIYGAVSFARLHGADHNLEITRATDIRGAYLVTLTAGSFSKDNHRLHCANPIGKSVEIPVGHVQFNAFEHVINFSELNAAVEGLRALFDGEIRADIETKVREAAVAAGISPEEALRARTADLVVTMVIDFSEEHTNDKDPSGWQG
ncbi:MAG TPA: hypothetical protein VHA10_06090 [Hypericibacter adhaerens]|jgi:hypothetical protein|nr:hypothetical protein [Hypericibacter adhaerens]HWA42762.1 hypothetical protein [Hypericibacter adhaerens]